MSLSAARLRKAHIRQKYCMLFCSDSVADHVLTPTRILTSPSWHDWGTAGKGRMGRYLTGTWHASEAMGSQEGRMCSVSAAHISAPCVGSDRLRRSPLVCSVVVHLDVQHVVSLHKSKLLGFGV